MSARCFREDPSPLPAHQLDLLPALFQGPPARCDVARAVTELFFLDEATALAAGHRPCAECQRGRYNEFMRCWALGNPGLVGKEKLRAPLVDAVLQKERFGPKGEKVKWRAMLGELPAGVMVEMGKGKACLVTEDGLKPWSPDGYGKLKKAPRDRDVLSLTPGSVVKGIEAGFVPASDAQ